MRTKLRTIGILGCLGVLGIGAAVFCVYRASRQIPDFYQEALRIDHTKTPDLHGSLEKQVLDLRNDSRHEGHWQELFTASQINHWLANDLPENFPHLVPQKIKEPRVAIESNRAQIACRYQDQLVSTVFSLTVDAYLTEERNVVAIRLYKVRAGILPVPMKKVLDAIEKFAQRAKLRLSWTQESGDPIALVTIPDKHKDMPGTFELETVELHEDGLRIAGRTYASKELDSSRSFEEIIAVDFLK